MNDTTRRALKSAARQAKELANALSHDALVARSKDPDWAVLLDSYSIQIQQIGRRLKTNSEYGEEEPRLVPFEAPKPEDTNLN